MPGVEMGEEMTFPKFIQMMLYAAFTIQLIVKTMDTVPNSLGQ